jgi:hypothetical protein
VFLRQCGIGKNQMRQAALPQGHECRAVRKGENKMLDILFYFDQYI